MRREKESKSIRSVRFEVTVNDRPPITAGARYGVFDAMITSVLRDPAAWHGHDSIEEWSRETLSLTVGGIDGGTDEFLAWLQTDLKIGDEVTVRILGEGNVDAPIRKPPWTEQSLRYDQLKEITSFLQMTVRHHSDHVFETDTSKYVAFLNILEAFEAEHPELAAELRPVEALSAAQLLERAERLLQAIDRA